MVIIIMFQFQVKGLQFDIISHNSLYELLSWDYKIIPACTIATSKLIPIPPYLVPLKEPESSRVW